MSSQFAQSRGGLLDRFFWDLSYKNRKILIPALMIIIIALSSIVLKIFIDMDLKLKRLSRFEPIYVLGVNRDLNIGDVISSSDLKAFLFYKNEYDKLITKDNSNLEIPSLIKCSTDTKTGSIKGFEDILGRVVNIPVYKNSFLRQEYLAPVGTLPGLINLIEKDHALTDVIVPRTGFNVYIKPNDLVDLSEIKKTGQSELIATKVKVILVDSLPLGKAPFHVTVDEKAKRHLTLSVPENDLARITNANKNNSLVLSYFNRTEESISAPKLKTKTSTQKNIDHFKSLMMITGSKKELITK